MTDNRLTDNRLTDNGLTDNRLASTQAPDTRPDDAPFVHVATSGERTLFLLRRALVGAAIGCIIWAALGWVAKWEVEGEALAMSNQLETTLIGKDISELDEILDPPAPGLIPASATVARDAEGWRVQLEVRWLVASRCVTVYSNGGQSMSSRVDMECPPLDTVRLASAEPDAPGTSAPIVDGDNDA